MGVVVVVQPVWASAQNGRMTELHNQVVIVRTAGLERKNIGGTPPLRVN